jgi:hypothetical protein
MLDRSEWGVSDELAVSPLDTDGNVTELAAAAVMLLIPRGCRSNRV